MNILFLLTQDLESPSGLGRYLPLAQELVKSGHQVTIAALHSNFRKLESNRIIINGVVVHYVAQMHVQKHGSIKTYFSPIKLISIFLKATISLTKAAIGIPADVIYIAKPHPMNGIAGVFARWLQGKELILDCDDYEAASNRFGNHWQKLIIAFFEKQIPKRANIITTNTYFMEHKLISWGVPKEKVAYIPNGIDPKRFPTSNENSLILLNNQLDLKNKKVIAYIGTISLPSHPVDLLVRAFPKVLEKVPNSVLMIVGGGEDLSVLKQLATELNIQDFVHFIGRVPPDDVHLYYGLSDVTVDPIHDDDAARGRAPLKLLESWISGVPFVSADVGDRTILIGKPPAGVLVTPNENDALVEGISIVLSNDDFRETLITRGKERCKNFYWELIAKSLEDLFLSTIYSSN